MCCEGDGTTISPACSQNEVDRFVGEAGEVLCRPVVAKARRVVDRALDLGIRHLGDHRAVRLELEDRSEHLARLRLLAGVDPDHPGDQLSPQVLRYELLRRSGDVGDPAAELGRRAAFDQVAEPAPELRAGRRRPEQQREGRRRMRMEPKDELGRDAEVRASPCSAQNSSGFSESLAVTVSPPAVSRVTESRLAQARPYLRSSQPEPPPRVSPATPVVETRPPVAISSCGWVARSKSLHTAPPCTVAVRASGSTLTAFILRMSITSAPVGEAGTRDAVAAAADRNLEVVAPSERNRLRDVVGARALCDHRRAPVDHRVEDLAGVLVTTVVRLEDRAGEIRAKLAGLHAAAPLVRVRPGPYCVAP